MSQTASIPSNRSSTTPAPKSEHLPSLDGLRAISILLVLLGHLSGTRNFATLDLGIGDFAHFGVVVFFVISGFLITTLLMAEHKKWGVVSLRKFYIRRSIRIFPAAYAYLAVLGCLVLLGVIHLTGKDFFVAATYLANFYPGRSWEIGHLWSLSVEEQFYLLWPFAFTTLKPKRAIWFALAGVVLAPIAKLAAWKFLRGTPWHAYHDEPLFPMVADSIAMGCLLAMRRDWLERQNWYLRLFHPVPSIALALTMLVINRYMGYTVVRVLGASVIHIILAFLIHRSVYLSTDLAGRFLNWKPFASIGLLSYSLYVWQQPFLNRNSTGWISAFPQNILLATAVALTSYFLLEKPLVKLRHRYRAA